MKFLGMFLMLSVFLFFAVNFFVGPMIAQHVPSVAQFVPTLTPMSSAGLAGLFCIGLLFTKK